MIDLPEKKQSIISTLTDLNVLDIISNKLAFNPVLSIIQSKSCSSTQLEKLISWILNDIENILNNSESAYGLRKLFKLEIPDIRSKLLESIKHLDVIKTLSSKDACDSVCLIISKESCSIEELEKIYSWVLPELQVLLANQTGRFAVRSLFHSGTVMI